MKPTTSHSVDTPHDDPLVTPGSDISSSGALPDAAPSPAVVLEDVQAGGNISIGGVTQTVTQFITRAPADKRANRQRTAMLELVENTWIKGLLLPSLPHNRRLHLQIQDRPELVNRNQWQETVQMPQQMPVIVNPNTDIVDVFRQCGQSLLIVGAPGSGKTTLLLILAQAMLAAAQADVQECMPVVLNLVSWSDRYDTLDGWIEEELRQKYLLPEKLAKSWLDNDELLLLLDGLDEVANPQRVACVAAINEFRSRHLVPIAVCSRLAEYEALPLKLVLQQAVEVCPLNQQQIEEFLSLQSPAEAELANLVRTDEQLRELAGSPLMLYVISTAAKHRTQGDLPATVRAADYKQRLWGTYVAAMFQRRSARHPYTPQQTTARLQWLAQQMQAHNQTIFLLEQMQPTLLSSRGERLFYHAGVRLTAILLFLILCPVLGVLAMAARGGSLQVGLNAGTAVGLVLAASVLLGSIAGYWLHGAAAVGTAAAVVGLTAGVSAGNILEGLVWGFVFAVPGALAGLAITGRQPLRMAEPFVWSLSRLIVGLSLGALAAVLVGLIIGLQAGWEAGLANSLAIGVSLAPALAIVLGVTKATTVQPMIAPNRGIRSSLRNTLRLFGLVALPSSILAVAWGILMDHNNAPKALAFGLVVALPLALIVTLAGGGGVLIQHYILRGALAVRGAIPWRFQKFLDYAAERVLLQRVGGGYMFYHRALMEHFAALEKTHHEVL